MPSHTDAFWPKISIVTPSYNQARFLERSILSVLNQGYPNLEYIIIDGGSTDGSVDIIKRYESKIAYWVSEPDRGQANALNKGFIKASGEIIGWLNSDDMYCPGSLFHVARWFRAHPECDVYYGGLYLIDPSDQVIDAHWACTTDPRYTFYVGLDVHQQALFWRRELMFRVGLLDEGLHFCLDRDFILRLLCQGRVERTSRYLGMFRVHEAAKTTNLVEVGMKEDKVIIERYLPAFASSAPRVVNRVRWQSWRMVRLLAEAPLSYLLFKVCRRMGIPASPRWLR